MEVGRQKRTVVMMKYLWLLYVMWYACDQ